MINWKINTNLLILVSNATPVLEYNCVFNVTAMGETLNDLFVLFI